MDRRMTGVFKRSGPVMRLETDCCSIYDDMDAGIAKWDRCDEVPGQFSVRGRVHAGSEKERKARSDGFISRAGFTAMEYSVQ